MCFYDSLDRSIQHEFCSNCRCIIEPQDETWKFGNYLFCGKCFENKKAPSKTTWSKPKTAKIIFTKLKKVNTNKEERP